VNANGWDNCQMVGRRQLELTMDADRIDYDFEAEKAYWQARLANLELLLCELLIKNERLRLEREMSKSLQSDSGSVLTNS
jgi:hypothetical protein